MGTAYTERLKDIPSLQLPVEKTWARQVYWMYGLVLMKRPAWTRSPLRKSWMPWAFRPPVLPGHARTTRLLDRGLFKDEHYPVAERIARQGLYLPSGLALTETQLEQVCETVRKVLGEKI